MSEASHQQRLPASNNNNNNNTHRDAAFSDIFGNAPPPGRAHTMTSSSIPPNFDSNESRQGLHNANSMSNLRQTGQQQQQQFQQPRRVSGQTPPQGHQFQQRQGPPPPQQYSNAPPPPGHYVNGGQSHGSPINTDVHGMIPPRMSHSPQPRSPKLGSPASSPIPGQMQRPAPPQSSGSSSSLVDGYGRPLPMALQPPPQHRHQSPPARLPGSPTSASPFGSPTIAQHPSPQLAPPPTPPTQQKVPTRGPPPPPSSQFQQSPTIPHNQQPPQRLPTSGGNSRQAPPPSDWSVNQQNRQAHGVPQLKNPMPPQQYHQQPPPRQQLHPSAQLNNDHSNNNEQRMNSFQFSQQQHPLPPSSQQMQRPNQQAPPSQYQGGGGSGGGNQYPMHMSQRHHQSHPPPPRAVSNPALSQQHFGPAMRSGGMPPPAQSKGPQDMRSMSMTSASTGGRQGGFGMTGTGTPYDRDHRPQATTMSGRVIPQRNSNEVIHLNQNKQFNNTSRNQSNSTLNSSLKPSHSTRSADGRSSTTTLNGNHRSTSTSSRASDDRSSYSHSTILTTSRKVPLVYPALLSKVADMFRQKIVVGDRIKNELTYKNSFTGAEAVDMITNIIKTPDRNLALLLGRALDAQKFFHDVTYDHRLRDTSNEVYQFNEIVVEEGAVNDGVNAAQLQAVKGTGAAENSAATATVPVNGVFTLLAECYSPTCTRDSLCYSIACPRRLEQQARLNMKPQPGLKRAESRLSLHGDDEKEQKLWIHTVSKEVADSTPDREKKRQEVVCEVIYTERDFVKDLEYLRDFWIKPLRNSNIIPESRREKFIRDVFTRIMDVHSVNIKLAEALTKRQQQAPVVKQIGDIFLEFVPKFDPFIRYGAHQLTGKYEFEREKSQNATFAKFVDETERLKESRKLELNGYLTKPTTRLARYPLLLEAVLKHTDDENPDKKQIPEAIGQIREFLTKVNIETGRAENRFNLLQLNQQLVWRSQHDYVDMHLTKENREIIFKGFLKKRTQDKENQGDVQVYLFDHCLLFVRIKTVNKREQLKVHRKPIPLELLQIAESEEMPSKLAKRQTGSLVPKISTVGKSETVSGNKFPLTFLYLGRRGYEITLYATTYIGRKKWVEHIESQQGALSKKGDVFNTHVLKDRFFSNNNKVNCLTPLDGGRKLLYGTDNGIWLAEVKFSPTGGPTTTDPVKVITLSNISQVDVLEEYGMLLALSDKTLYAWPLDCLETPDPVGNSRRSKKIMGHVNFYRVGICLGRVLVCTVKSSSLTTTVRVMEPNEPQPRRQQKPFSKLLKSQSEGLKVFKEFYIPSEALSISFLKRRLCVGCVKGFEIVDLKTLETQSLLDPADTSLDFVIRRDVLKPISIFPLGRNFLLNYTDVSFFVNANGWRSRQDWKIEWEGVPTHFTFSYPFLIAFEPQFIEIRHVDTGELVRVITGENIRFLHESTREIIYVHEDVYGNDEVISLDFWEKNSTNAMSNEKGLGQQSPQPPQLMSTPLASVHEE